jgi:hypothetical protein
MIQFSNANTSYVTTVTFKGVARRDTKMRSATWMIWRAVREGQHRVQTDAASSRNKHPWVKRMRPTGRPASDGREGNQKSPLRPIHTQHAAPMPFPCHAVPLRVRMCLSHLLHTVRPCLIHVCHAMPIPRQCHALTMPFFSRPRHSMAVERRPVGYLPAFGFFRLPRGVPRSLLSEAYQFSSQRSIPTYDCKEW